MLSIWIETEGRDIRISVSVPSVLKSWVKEASAAPRNLTVAVEWWFSPGTATGTAMAVAARVETMERMESCIAIESIGVLFLEDWTVALLLSVA